jgi:hypothetical protein
MKRTLIILLFFLSASKTFSQLNINTNDVLDTDSLTQLSWPIYFDSLIGIKPITKSNNLLEIRLYEISMSGYRCRTLCFDGTKWSGKIIRSFIFQNDSLIKLNYSLNFKAILDTLIEYRIFTLPSQRLLTLEGSVDDGMNYSVSYKVGLKYRNYDFSNPDVYLKEYEKNKDVQELKLYIAIIDIFDKLYRPN